MREIKFRAWDDINKRMIYPYAKGFNNILSNGDILNKWEIVMQFTGAQDCEGNDIYDGDIIRFDPKEWGDNETNIHTVSWYDYDCGWSFGGGSQQGDMEWRTVIGNIYENPELL